MWEMGELAYYFNSLLRKKEIDVPEEMLFAYKISIHSFVRRRLAKINNFIITNKI